LAVAERRNLNVSVTALVEGRPQALSSLNTAEHAHFFEYLPWVTFFPLSVDWQLWRFVSKQIKTLGNVAAFFFFLFSSKSACMEKQQNKLFNVEIKRVLFDKG